MEQINIWELLAGLGIFLFGMLLLEESIRNLSGRAFKRFIHKYTEGRLKAILAGTFATAILQSSSAVSLMVLAFVGAGIMSMGNAIGVIIGSNLGTTLTSWIVATVGFKLKIEALALPFIGIGGLGLLFFGKSTKATNISKLLVGFGFLFMGLDYMKNSIDSLSGNIDIEALAGYGTLAFVLLGFVLTAIVQSSSAAMAIILSAVHTGIISFPLAAAMVIGTNIGTTVTVLIGTVGAVPIKKRVAYSHFFFNFITGIIAFLLLPLLIQFIHLAFHLERDPVIELAIFHTLFNLIGVTIFFPFIGLLGKFITRLVPEKTSAITLFINKVSPEIPGVPEAGIVAIQKETDHLLRMVFTHNLFLLSKNKKSLFVSWNDDKHIKLPKSLKPENLYINIKLLQAEIFSFTSKTQKDTLTEPEAREINKTLHAVRYAVASAKSLKDVRQDLDEMYNADDEFMNRFFYKFREKTDEMYSVFYEVLSQQDKKQNLPVLVKLINQLYKSDADFVTELTAGINQGKVSDINISVMLSANRGFILSTRQAIFALRDLLFTEEETALFENLEHAGEV